jgi:hypothetical protein
MNRIGLASLLGISVLELRQLTRRSDFPRGRQVKVQGYKKPHRIWAIEDIEAAQRIVATLRREGFL